MQPASSEVDIIEAIPILRLPRTLGVFDYLGNDHHATPLMPGQLITVPFRGRMVTAVVLRTKRQVPNPSLRYRALSAVVTPTPYVSKTQLALAQWMSAYYMQSPALILRAMIPALPRRFLLPNRNEPVPFVRLPLLPPDQQAPLNQIIDTAGTHLLHGEIPDDWLVYLAALVVQRGRQVLLVVPEADQGKRKFAVLRQSLGACVLLQPDTVSKLATAEFWQRAASGTPLVVIGTRRAVFAPLDRIAMIIVLAEDDSSLKQWEQNPRYHARETAAKLAELSGATLLYTSATPSVVSHWRAKQGVFSYHAIPTAHAANVELVDMRTEFAARNFSPLSRRVQELLHDRSQTAGLQAVLIVNRKGAASFVRCRDCGYVPRCPICALPFRFHLGGKLPMANSSQRSAVHGDLYCYRCRQAAVVPHVCPKCHGVNLRSVGTGVQRVVALVRRLLTGVTVCRYDADLSFTEQAEVITQLRAGRVGVMVATAQILHLTDPTTAPLVAVLTPDSDLQHPDFLAAERTLHLLTEARRLAKHTFLVQTALPNHPLYQSLSTGKSELFYESEEMARRDFKYPPFSRVISLTYHHQEAVVADREAVRIAGTLRERLGDTGGLIEIIGPSPAIGNRRSRRFGQQIVMKVHHRPNEVGSLLGAPQVGGKPLATLLSDVPDTWVIDVDPITI